MKNLETHELRHLNGGYFAPAGTTLSGRDESMRKYAEMAVNDIWNGFWSSLSKAWS